MSDLTPAPVRGPIVATGPVKAARALWLISFVLGLLAAYFIFLFRADQLDRLSELLTGLNTTQDAQTLRALATLLVWASLGALVLVVAIESTLLVVMLRRHGWVRWVLLGVLVLHAGVWVVVDAVIVAPEEQVIYFGLLLLAQLVLASVALILSFFPGASEWFRAEHEAGRGRRG